MRRQNIGTLASLMTAVVLITGCAGSTKGLEEVYSFERELDIFSVSANQISRAEPFASDLCVVSEDPYNDSGITSEAAAVFDLQNHQVISGKQVFERLHPASTTKVMTALIAIKYGNLSDQVTVTEDAVITEAGATLAKINPGDVLTMEQLLYGLMLPSGNDAGAAIAVHMAGSIENFSDMMNAEAVRLGATGTHFMNPHGLTDADHYSTAYDLYLIFNEALKYPLFREVTKTTSYTVNYINQAGEPVNQTWKGGNWYLTGERETPEGLTVFSGKTGTTSAAGYCLVMASSDADDHEYISVVLKAGSRPGLYDNMTNIIEKIVK